MEQHFRKGWHPKLKGKISIDVLSFVEIGYTFRYGLVVNQGGKHTNCLNNGPKY